MANKFSYEWTLKDAVFTNPLDYDFMGRIPHYVCGMSVPPVMMANIATRIYEQILQSI